MSDEFHVAFITYDVKPGKVGPALVEGKKLRNNMRGFDGLFLRPFHSTSSNLLRRPDSLARPVRNVTASVAATLATQATAARVQCRTCRAAWLLRRIAMATGRYTQCPPACPLGSPVAAHRLTDHLADDLYPTWSPDGTQIAFTSPGRDGDAEIYIMRLADGALSRVTRQLIGGMGAGLVAGRDPPGISDRSAWAVGHLRERYRRRRPRSA